MLPGWSELTEFLAVVCPSPIFVQEVDSCKCQTTLYATLDPVKVLFLKFNSQKPQPQRNAAVSFTEIVTATGEVFCSSHRLIDAHFDGLLISRRTQLTQFLCEGGRRLHRSATQN